MLIKNLKKMQEKELLSCNTLKKSVLDWLYNTIPPDVDCLQVFLCFYQHLI